MFKFNLVIVETRGKRGSLDQGSPGFLAKSCVLFLVLEN